MKSIKAVWLNGQIVPSEPVNWPDGSPLLVEPVLLSERLGLDEAEWQDSAEALADWDSWIHTIEPLEFTEEERASLARFREEFRRFNLEAVRNQMASGNDE